MEHTTVTIGTDGGAVASARLEERVQAYMLQGKAANTWTSYQRGWRDFTRWCTTAGQEALPATPGTVTAYLLVQAERWTISTLQRRLASIAQAHAAKQFESPTKHPTVRLVWAGLRRAKGTAQQGKAALSTAQLRALVGC